MRSVIPNTAVPGASRLSADVGGTFTDVILWREDGRVSFRKVLSTPPEYDRAVIDAFHELLAEDAPAGGAALVDKVVHGTTVATNAVLERRGRATALVTTAGFRDVLELRRVRIPNMYDMFWDKPAPLVPRRLRFELNERVMADGRVLSPVDEAEVRGLAKKLRDARVEAVAVCFLHAHRHPGHEELAGAILREELPGVVISLSSEIIREQQEYERTAATAVNAYVRPLMSVYLHSLREGIAALGARVPLMIMQSSGGLMTAEDAEVKPVYALESGPAAGVVASINVAQRLGLHNVITFDMGGTTAKASLVEEGRVSRSREYEVGGSLSAGGRLLRGTGELIRVPSIDIAEVGAGGGSLAWLDGAGALQVGPRSAGADPGPACYGKGGTEPTVTDANVLLGYIRTGPLAGGDLVISAELAESAVAQVAKPLGLSSLEAARGIHTLANARMMRALRVVSSEKGRDPRHFALMAYGGSGPIHAAALADELGVTTVVVPPLAGLFSSVGLLFGRVEFHDVRFCEFDARSADLELLREYYGEMQGRLATMAGASAPLEWQRSADVRYKGQSWDIEVDLPDGEIDSAALAVLVERFEDEHERLYGVRLDAGSPVDIRALRLAVFAPATDTSAGLRVPPAEQAPGAGSRACDFGPRYGTVETRVVHGREALGEHTVDGPLLIDEYDTTVVVPPGWSIVRGDSDCLLLERVLVQDQAETGQPGSRHDDETAADPITQQVVANALATVADEMAATIFRTAHSTVVRDALDFSAALCGPTAETIAQAVTIPLQLGSLQTAMRVLTARFENDIRPGDIYVMNDPFSGGIHTSDIYVAKPVFSAETLIGFAVSVAHHADVGGRLPGTTACDNREIFEEGLRLPWVRLYEGGKPIDDIFSIIETNVRIPSMTLGDLRAQIAATIIGDRGLVALADRYGAERLNALMAALTDHTERLVRGEIAAWPDGSVSATDYLDSDGIELREVPITVHLTIEGDEIVADLSDSAPMVRGALNCTHSFVEASVFQPVIAAIVAEVPLTAGAFRPIRIKTKPGTVTHVVMPGASSMRGITGFRIVDATNLALSQLLPARIPAAPEGGNSLAIFSGLRPGGDRFVYYELVVGTGGARPTADGNDGVSNPCGTAANIPVEVAEAEFPILIEHYGYVRDTAGPGKYRGGVALERAWRSLVGDTSLQVRSDRRIHRPYGLSGGGPGAASTNRLSVGDGGPEELLPMFSTVIQDGDLFYHRTAGGGGWGDPLDRAPAAVREDVLDEKVSVGAARSEYGVALRPDGMVDDEATADLRRDLRAGRAPR